MIRRIIPIGLVIAGLSLCPFASAQDNKGNTLLPIQPASPQSMHVALKLDDAIAWGLEHSQILRASSSRADAATASGAQAGALPNPELSVEVENVYGNGPYDGLGGAEITYGVTQLVELPGKRSSRIQMAMAEKAKVQYDSEAKRLDLIRDITIAFAELFAAQRNLDVVTLEHELAREVSASVAARVDAGKEPPIQKNKAAIELASSDIALDRARRALSTKRQALTVLMGRDTGDFAIEAQSLPTLSEPEPIEAYMARLQLSPDARAFEAEVTRAQSVLSLEKANALPDPTIGLGIRQFRDEDSQAFVGGVSLPIPVFNLNRAGIQRAGNELGAAKLEQHGERLTQEAQLTAAYNDLYGAYREAVVLNDTVLPGAEEAFSFSRQGYDAGKFGYLEILDSQRTLFRARQNANAAILNYHRALAGVERIASVHAHKDENKE